MTFLLRDSGRGGRGKVQRIRGSLGGVARLCCYLDVMMLCIVGSDGYFRIDFEFGYLSKREIKIKWKNIINTVLLF